MQASTWRETALFESSCGCGEGGEIETCKRRLCLAPLENYYSAAGPGRGTKALSLALPHHPGVFEITFQRKHHGGAYS